MFPVHLLLVPNFLLVFRYHEKECQLGDILLTFQDVALRNTICKRRKISFKIAKKLAIVILIRHVLTKETRKL